MSQNIINARVTFRNSPIHVLEKFTFKDLDSAYLHFKKHSGLSECVILQTCNRVELFATGKDFDLEKINIDFVIFEHVCFGFAADRYL